MKIKDYITAQERTTFKPKWRKIAVEFIMLLGFILLFIIASGILN